MPGELVLDGMLHELHGAGVTVDVPVLCHVKELGPGWLTNPMLGNRLSGLEEALAPGVGGWSGGPGVVPRRLACLSSTWDLLWER